MYVYLRIAIVAFEYKCDNSPKIRLFRVKNRKNRAKNNVGWQNC